MSLLLLQYYSFHYLRWRHLSSTMTSLIFYDDVTDFLLIFYDGVFNDVTNFLRLRH